MLQFKYYDRWRPVLWREKIKQERGNEETLQFKIEWSENTSLRIFEQRAKENEEGSHADIWKKSISGKENSKCKRPVDKECLACLRNVVVGMLAMGWIKEQEKSQDGVECSKN